MTEPEYNLKQHLAAWLASLPEADIRALLEAARDDARDNLRTRLRALMGEVLLDQVSTYLEEAVPRPALRRDNVPPTEPAPPVPALDAAQVQQEIAALREQLARNERALSEARRMPAPQPMRNPRFDDGEGNDPDEGYYVYGIVAGTNVPSLLQRGLAGIDTTHPVYLLPHEGISALVSRVSLEEFGEAALEQRVQDTGWLEDKVRIHQQVLGGVLADVNLLPFAFGTIYTSEHRVRVLLEERCLLFQDRLARLAGCEEWGVKLFCDEAQMRAEVGTISPQVQAMRERINGVADGTAYMLQRRLDSFLVGELERRQEEIVQHSHRMLSQHAIDAVQSLVQSSEVTGRREVMLLNGAYLIQRAKLPAFRAALDDLARTYAAGGMIYELTGPWPSYNFSNLNSAEMLNGQSAENYRC
ncbi:MAG: GvpL/GvpF family gas vesicle protein [Chloroflexaceae bacterium]|nr:GvpL/GvpF family gas vesicle protein [Chloroflexaceae bacterium]